MAGPSILLSHHGLPWTSASTAAPIGATDPAGVAGGGAALSTILDLEDSVAAVDAEDKLLAYGNLAGHHRGTLTETCEGRQDLPRAALNADRRYTRPSGEGDAVARPQRCCSCATSAT